MKLFELDELIRAVCPIEGINSNGIIWYAPEASPEQKADAQALVQEHLAQLETSFPL
ncbi:MAG: hypothetical protein ACK5R4_01870 [Alphaproteobacteria bacterium]|jgi:hypothetical protein